MLRRAAWWLKTGSGLPVLARGHGSAYGRLTEVRPHVVEVAAVAPSFLVLGGPRLLRCAYDFRQAGDQLTVDRSINGRLTCAETSGHCQFLLTKTGPSAGGAEHERTGNEPGRRYLV